MQRFLQREDKRLAIKMPEGKTIDYDELMLTKNALLNRIARETDPEQIAALEILLTQTNSALKAISTAEGELASTRLEIETKRREAQAEGERNVRAEQKKFESNCWMIAGLKLQRLNPSICLEPAFDPPARDR